MDSENRLTQQGTSSSMSDTLVRPQHHEGRPSLRSLFLGPPLMTESTSPQQSSGASQLTLLHSEQSTLSPSVRTPPISDPARKRTLVLCFDGTGDKFNATNSNVVKFVSVLRKDDSSKQMVYYQAGIGTYSTIPIVGKLSSMSWKLLDLMFAFDVNDHIISGYEFLMQTYNPGDKIYLFGFSRGAHTARSLAGMIQKVGLLTPNNFQQVPFAYKMYTQCNDLGWEQSTAFKKAFSLDVDIEFIGVWDTVDSVGVFPKRTPFASSPTIIHTFRHALALDERRVKFKATPWNRPNPKEKKLGVKQELKKHLAKSAVKEKNPSSEGTNEEMINFQEQLHPTNETKKKTDVKEVWFAGCHSDVGGGSVPNAERYSLARIPLRWMIRECFKTKTGILFDFQGLRDLGLDVSTLDPCVPGRPPPLPVRDAAIQHVPQKVAKKGPQNSPSQKSPSRKSSSPIRRFTSLFSRAKEQPHSFPHAAVDRSENEETGAEETDSESETEEIKAEEIPIGSEEEEELKDALSPIHDSLKLKRGWWIPELMPLKIRYQLGDKRWVEKWIFNRGGPRYIPGQHGKEGIRIHRSVKTRMDACYPWNTNKYSPSPEIRAEPFWEDLDADDSDE